MWDLPRLRTEHMSPGLVGKFFTTEPPGTPCFVFWGFLLLLLLLFVARFLDQENLERPGFESDAISKLHFVWSTLESLWVYLHIEKKTTPNIFHKNSWLQKTLLLFANTCFPLPWGLTDIRLGLDDLFWPIKVSRNKVCHLCTRASWASTLFNAISFLLPWWMPSSALSDPVQEEGGCGIQLPQTQY